MTIATLAPLLRGLTVEQIREVDLAAVPVPLVRAIAHAKDALQCGCLHLRGSHGHYDPEQRWLGMGLGECYGHPYIGPCDQGCLRFTVRPASLEPPRCTMHGEQMLRRFEQTPEETWCGTWWDCPLDTCACLIVVPSPELVAFLEGHEQIAPGKGTR